VKISSCLGGPSLLTSSIFDVFDAITSATTLRRSDRPLRVQAITLDQRSSTVFTEATHLRLLRGTLRIWLASEDMRKTIAFQNFLYACRSEGDLVRRETFLTASWIGMEASLGKILGEVQLEAMEWSHHMRRESVASYRNAASKACGASIVTFELGRSVPTWSRRPSRLNMHYFRASRCGVLPTLIVKSRRERGKEQISSSRPSTLH
jgi:hypothetical protein